MDRIDRDASALSNQGYLSLLNKINRHSTSHLENYDWSHTVPDSFASACGLILVSMFHCIQRLFYRKISSKVMFLRLDVDMDDLPCDSSLEYQPAYVRVACSIASLGHCTRKGTG
jgi:hypothetical protein